VMSTCVSSDTSGARYLTPTFGGAPPKPGGAPKTYFE
jgi:hypothetical protein